MSVPTETIGIQILKNQYNIRCNADEVAALQKAAARVDSLARTCQQSNRALTAERLLLNVCLLLSKQIDDSAEQTAQSDRSMQTQLNRIESTLDDALIEQQEVELTAPLD